MVWGSVMRSCLLVDETQAGVVSVLWVRFTCGRILRDMCCIWRERIEKEEFTQFHDMFIQSELTLVQVVSRGRLC